MTRGLAAVFVGVTAACGAPLVDFPTPNRALANGRPAEFYMYVDRDFEGEKTKPWEGGQFGYVRGPQRVGSELIYRTLHEGIDIRPVRRDAAGEPLDDVFAAADGKVVHVSGEAGGSNYGRYIVVEHTFDNSPVYTLYAHMGAIAVEPGARVVQGQRLGRMGYTGAGINRERAHLHFEVCLRLSDHFDAWHVAHFKGNPNRHGNFNGLNLVGMDAAALLLEAGKNPALTLRDFLAAQPVAFELAIPNSPDFGLLRRYPWMVAPGEVANPPGWIVSFSTHGVPLKIRSTTSPVPEPAVVRVQPTSLALAHVTRGIVSGTQNAPVLTDSGRRFVRLLLQAPPQAADGGSTPGP
jgi:murein DD-endopeptidase MepM/ murein hydrolase activator NlpD